MQMMWGDYMWSKKKQKFVKLLPEDPGKPMFVSMILEPLWAFYGAALLSRDKEKAARMCAAIGIEVPVKELSAKDSGAVQAILRRWLPLPAAVLQMVVETVPAPPAAQAQRAPALWAPMPPPPPSAPPPPVRFVVVVQKEGVRPRGEVCCSTWHSLFINNSTMCVCDNPRHEPSPPTVSSPSPLGGRDPTRSRRRWRRSPGCGPRWRPAPGVPGCAREGRGGGGEVDSEEEIFVAFARVFAGTLTRESAARGLYALGPKYRPFRYLPWCGLLTSLGAEYIIEWARRLHNCSNPSVIIVLRMYNDIIKYTTGRVFGLTPLALFFCNSAAPSKLRERHLSEIPADTYLPLFLMMGSSLLPVEQVQAGNLVAIAGIEKHILKCGTLSSTPYCPGFKAIALQAKPMVRVAVGANNSRDLPALENGLRQLYQADPAVECSLTRSGEHIIAALGELHMEQCLKDLRERYARVELHASPPIVPFREAMVSPKDLVASNSSSHSLPKRKRRSRSWLSSAVVQQTKRGNLRIVLPSGLCAFTITCVPLPEAASKIIDEYPEEATAAIVMNKLGTAYSGNLGGVFMPAIHPQITEPLNPPVGSTYLVGGDRAVQAQGNQLHGPSSRRPYGRGEQWGQPGI
ncbi:unnamed protein product [Heterosigma akashiwo]